jgi:hypothetical protein
MSVTAMHWQNQANASESGNFVYAGSQAENYYLVPVEVLQANASFDITVTYRDGTTSNITLTSAQLAHAETAYAF